MTKRRPEVCVSCERWDLIQGLVASAAIVAAFYMGRSLGRRQVREVFHKAMRRE